MTKKSAIGKLLDDLFTDKKILKLMSHQYEYDKSLSALHRLLFVAAAKLNETASNDLNSMRDEIVSAFELFNIDSRSALMTGLSILELTLIVVILETTEAYPDEPFNFELIYNAYLKFLNRKNWGQQRYERQIVLKVRLNYIEIVIHSILLRRLLLFRPMSIWFRLNSFCQHRIHRLARLGHQISTKSIH